MRILKYQLPPGLSESAARYVTATNRWKTGACVLVLATCCSLITVHGLAAEATTKGTQPLIAAAALKRKLADNAVLVLDIRDPAVFRIGHLPGAISVDIRKWEAELFRNNCLSKADFWSRNLGSVGIDGRKPIVICADLPAYGARVWWLLRYAGVPKVQVLDGGWQAWQQSGGPVSEQPDPVVPCEFTAELQSRCLVTKDALLRDDAYRQIQMIDNRSPDEFAGSRAVGSRAGRIPGAIHIDWLDLLDESGHYRSPDQLRKLFVENEIRADQPIATYCYSGIRSSVGALALELAGFGQVQNYVGGWREWSADRDAPAEVDNLDSPEE